MDFKKHEKLMPLSVFNPNTSSMDVLTSSYEHMSAPSTPRAPRAGIPDTVGAFGDRNSVTVSTSGHAPSTVPSVILTSSEEAMKGK